ncbi:MAG: hypothetical protein AAGF71_09855 [Pseudomonadota bacterium]
MSDLAFALTPKATLARPVQVGPWTITEITSDGLWSVSASDPATVAWPAVGRTENGVHRIGADLAFVETDSAPPAPSDGLWTTDQTDGWTRIEVTGGDLRPALAYLISLDLGDPSFPNGACARTQAAHLSVILTRKAADHWTLWTPRSSAESFLHHLEEACRTAL